MNFYPHRIGDHASATSHLSMLEDCAYRRLLDWYFLDEKPIPLDARKVYRRVRASSDAEREAVDVVLAEFFTKTEEGYRHGKSDDEMERIRITSEERSAAAAKRWNAKRERDAMQQGCKEDANACPDDANASADDAKGIHSQYPKPNTSQSPGRLFTEA